MNLSLFSVCQKFVYPYFHPYILHINRFLVYSFLVNIYNNLNKPDLSTLINKIINYIDDSDLSLELCFGKSMFWVRVLYYGF